MLRVNTFYGLFVFIFVLIGVAIIISGDFSIKYVKDFLLIISLLFIIKYTFFDYPFVAETAKCFYPPFSFKKCIDYYNFIPFKTIIECTEGASIFIRQVIGNICLFIPLGFSLSLYLHNKKINKFKVVLLGFISSVLVELFQFIFAIKTGFIFKVVDIDDILCNTIGFCLGVICEFYIVHTLMEGILRKRSKKG